MAFEQLRVVLVETPEHASVLADAAANAFPAARCVQVDSEGALRTTLLDVAPDVVLYGLHCPDFDGISALRLTRRLAPDAVYVVVVGPADRERAAACLWEGADDYVARRELGRLGDVVIACRIRKRPRDVASLRSDPQPEPPPAPPRDLTMLRELERGLALAEMRVHYHATVSLATGRIAGFEALLRWKHPRRGLLLPQDFMAVAEENGLMVPMGRWVIREACRFARLLGEGVEAPPGVSVNLSPRQFARRDVVDQVHGILKETGVSGRRLRFELTESMILEDLDDSARKLSRLKEMGIAVDIDDFGLGYASLNFLRALPIDAVKIDRSIVDRMGTEPSDLAMVRSVVQLTRRLGLASVAEGVRRQEDVDQLGRLGCQYGQGFFYSPPVHAPGARGLLERRWPAALPMVALPARHSDRAAPLPRTVTSDRRIDPFDRGFLGDPSHLPALLDRLDRLGRG